MTVHDDKKINFNKCGLIEETLMCENKKNKELADSKINKEKKNGKNIPKPISSSSSLSAFFFSSFFGSSVDLNGKKS